MKSNLLVALDRAAKNGNGSSNGNGHRKKKTVAKRSPAPRKAPAKKAAPKKSITSMIASLRARGYSVKKR